MNSYCMVDYICYFAPYCSQYESKIFLSNGMFFTRCLSIAITLPMFVHVSERETFCHQILANLPWKPTEIVRFLKMLKVCFFLKKDIDLSRKQT